MSAHAAAWTVFGSLLLFKVLTLAIILLVAPSGEAVALVVVTNWPFIPLVVTAVALPAAFWIRLLRMRAKRRSLIRAEFMWD